MTQRDSENLPPGQYVKANGLKIYYEEYGSGEPLILLHGATDTCKLWKPHLPHLTKHFQVITPDSRGHGRTRNPSGDLSYQIMADDLAALIQALNLKKPLIFGYSDGGQIGLDLGIRYPELPGALVLGGVWYRFSKTYQEGLRKAGFEGPGEVNFETIDENTQPGWIDRMREAHPHPDPDYYQELLKNISALWWKSLKYSKEDFDKVLCPTLVIIGDRDEMIPLEQAHEMVEMIPRAELGLIPGATHNEVLKEGGMFLQLTLDFLSRYSE